MSGKQTPLTENYYITVSMKKYTDMVNNKFTNSQSQIYSYTMFIGKLVNK